MTAAKEQVWALLRRHALVAGEVPLASAPRTVWFVRVMLGVGGWLGAVFLLGFVAVGFEFIIDRPAASFLTGALVCAGAAALFRAGARSDFLQQFAFALSLAGQGLMAWGITRGIERQSWAAATGIATQQAALFFLIPNSLHRVWAAGTAAVALAYALRQFHLAPYAPFLLTGATAWVWLKEFEAAEWASPWRAGGYGLALAAVLTTFDFEWPSGYRGTVLGGEISQWLGAVLGGAVLVWAAAMLLRREARALWTPAGRGALLVAVILGAAALKAPGIAPAVAVLVVGFANGNRILAAFGIVALIGYLSHYYYSLQASLLEKSALLATAGVALLLARLVMHRAWPQSNEEAPRA